MSNNSIASIDRLIQLGEFEKAESECVILLDKDENNASAFCKLGEIYMSQEKEVEAQIFFEKAVKVDDHNYFSIISLADLYDNICGKQKAEQFLWDIINTSYKNINVMINLALESEKMQKYDLTEIICNFINRKIPGNMAVNEILIRVKNYYSLFYVVHPQVISESELGKYLTELVDSFKPKVIVDIGAATGLGSTKLLAERVIKLNYKSKIYAVEAQKETFKILKNSISKYSFVEPIWGTFINKRTVPNWETVSSDIKTYGLVLLESYSENEIKNWYENNVSIINDLSQKQKGAKELIKEEIFDLVFFDSGEFFAKEEMKEFVNKSNIIVLDDINTYKNSFNHQYLSNNPDWVQLKCDTNERNGWSAFKRKDFLVRENIIKSELIKSVYVSQEIEVFYGENASGFLEKNNDKKYLTDKGIIQVDKHRWATAQKYERKTWMERSLGDSDDRNFEHSTRFNNYDSLRNGKFEKVIELGCGPFTNLRLVLPLIRSIKSVTLLDPLITDYLRHPNCTYKNGTLAGYNVQTIGSTIEEFIPNEKYDLVVMNNVLEHCYNIPKIFEVLTSMLNDGGIFIFADVAFNTETVNQLVEKQYDAGHPIRLNENFLEEFLSKHFNVIYEKIFLGLYDQPYRKDFYFIGKHKSVTNSQTQLTSIHKSSNSPVIHFVYSGDPKNDAVISAPQTITNKLYRFFEKHLPVKYYNLDDVNTVVNVGVNDIVIGHPHPQKNTAIRRLFTKHAAAKFLLWPFHSALPEINHYVLDLAEQANNLFMISGPYWTDNIEKTEFAQWKNKIVRLDNAVDVNIFRLSKKTFNGKGNRGLFVLGRSGKEKGTTRLFKLLAQTSYRILIAGEYSTEDIAIISNRNNITILGSISWLDASTVNKIISECDYFVNMSFSDASPTTLLETMAVGLIPITTPQCGYYYPSLIMLSDDDMVNHNILKHAQSMSEEYLKELQNNNRNIIEQRHNWENITQQIWEKMLPFINSTTGQKNTKKVKVAGDHEESLDLTKIDDHSSFAQNIKKIFKEKSPKKIIETGTYHGTGTTTIIAQTLNSLDSKGAKFYSIEVNPENHKKAKSNLTESGLLKYVSLLNGVSVPRSILPNQTDIVKTTVDSIEYDDIFVDHKENERVQLYFNETNFPEVSDDLLGKTLKEFDYRPDFVLLDSAGHMGFIEFQYLLSQIKGNCIIALDDIYHIKHHKSFRFMQDDPRFKILISSKEKFGFCVAEFTYDSNFAEENSISNLDAKEIINCLLCGSGKSTIVHEPDIVKCDECGFVYLKLRPTQKWMENYYKEVYAVNDPAAAVTVAVPSDVKLLDTKQEYIAAQRRSLFEEAVAHYGKNIQGGTLVDIGCGWGALLYNARKNGMNVIGFEFTNHNVQFAKHVLNIDVRQQQFVDSDIPEGSVDIVTMSHVLEHVPDPLKLVEKINHVLKPGGIFYCVVPNFYSLCSAYLGEKWEWLDRNWHYSQFSVDSIQKLFLKIGLSVEHISTTTGDFGTKIPTQILKNKFPDKSNQELLLILEEMNKQTYGEEIRIIGKKTGNEIPKKYDQDDKNILWVRTDAIGDNILASSMLKPLKAAYSNYKITVVCQNVVRELYETSPYVDKIISFDVRKIYLDKKYQNEILTELQTLKADYAFNSIYSRDLLSDYLTINSFAKNKIAHSGDLSNILKEQKEENNKHYTRLIETNPSSVTELERHADFLAGINVGIHKLEATIWLNEEDSNYAENVFSKSQLKSERTLALFAGAQHEVRIFNDYGKAVNEFCSKNGFEVVVLGSNKDDQINKVNIKDLTGRVVDLTGKTTLRQSAAILKKCAIAVGAETGLAHIACAIGIPNLILLGGGHFGRFMPYSKLTSVVSLPLECFGCNWQCKYGTSTCIKDIDYKVISNALESMLKDKHEKTLVYLQSNYKYDFLSNLPKISGIEHLLKGEYELKVVEPTSTEVSLSFLETLTESKNEKIYNTICKLNELFIKNGKDVKAYAAIEKKLLTQNTKLSSLLNSIPKKLHGNPFYNYLIGLLFENEGKMEASYKHYFATVRTTENLRALYKLAHIAEHNINTPYVVYLFQELHMRGVEATEMLKKANYWIELLSIKSINKLSPISESLIVPALDQTKAKSDNVSPFVSIVLPSKNRADGLIAFLNSLEAACFGINYEVLLYAGDEIDDKYKKLIEQYEIKKVYFDKEIFESKQPFSWSKLMNHGFNNSDGEWIMYASDDIVLHPLAINFALQYTDAEMVGGISFMHRNTIQDYDGFFKEYGYDVYGERTFINFGLIKKEVFRLVKGFDEALKFYAADTDICWRIIEKRYKIIPSYYSLVEHINIEDATKVANSGKTYRADTFAFYKKWFHDICRFENKMLVRERFTIPDIKQIKKCIYETSIKNNISIANILSIDKEYEQFTTSQQRQEEKQIKVSAIVSTYNSEKFIKGCLEDLVSQSLYKSGELEIVIIDSGSDEGEGKIIEEFQKKYKNIYYERTEKETIYSAWNRGIKIASGKYLTNANTDDRHRKDALEIFAKELDANDEIGTVYADQFVTKSENQTFDNHDAIGYFEWLEFDRIQLIHCACVGPQPMWRKSLHEKFGYFDESLKVAGDYDWWLRISEKVQFKHIPEKLGLYLLSDNSVEHRYTDEMRNETIKVRLHYGQKAQLQKLDYTKYKSTFLVFTSEKQPLVSVIIPTFNRADKLKDAIASALAQSYKNIEVIVVNDAGKDVTAVVKQFNNVRVSLINQGTNKGLSASRNIGIKAAKGEYIALLDDDDIFYSNHLQIALNNFSDQHKVIYTDAVRNSYVKVGKVFTLQAQTVPYSIDYNRDKLLIGNIAPVNCFVFEKSLAIKVGLFDESLPVLEDWDFWLRLSSITEFKHVKENTVQVNWYNDGSTMTSSKGKDFEEARKLINQKYEAEIKSIPNLKEIIAEFNAIWGNDFTVGLPLVSIIALSYNQLEYTKSFVESVIKYTNVPFELILVDNASNIEAVQFLNSLSTTDKRIKTIFNSTNKGFPKGVNQGINLAVGKYVLIANNDIVVTKDWIERMIEVAESKNEIGLVGPISNAVSGVQLDKAAKYDSIVQMHKYAKQIQKKNQNKIVEFPRVAFLCTLIKKEVIEKIGGLDERFSPGNFEDDDFCLRAQVAGYKTVIAQDVFIHHYGSKSFKANGIDEYAKRLEHNKQVFIEKWGADPEEIWLKGKSFKRRNPAFPIDKNPITANIKRAMIYLDEKEYQSAFIYLNEVIESYEEYSTKDFEHIGFTDVLNLAANAALMTGDYQKASELFEKELNTNPTSSRACAGLAETFLTQEKYNEAKTMLEWSVKNDPNNQSARSSLEKVNQELGLPKDDNSLNTRKSVDEQIEELFAETYSLYEKKLFNDSLTVLIELEKFIDARPEEVKPEIAASIFNLSGFNYLALGENDMARQSFEKSLNIVPDSSTACAGLGEIFYLEGRDAEAKTMYEWGVKNDPNNQLAVSGLKKINAALGLKVDHNPDSYRDTPKSIDEQIEELFTETYSLYEKKSFNESLTVLFELEKFVDSSTEEIHPDTLVSIINLSGYNYLGLNDIDNARESFERALNINPSSSSACAGLGEIYATFAMDTEAKTMFEWAVKNNPENQTAVSSLANVNQRLGFSQNHNSLVLKNINPLRIIEKKLDLAEELLDKDRNDEAEKLLQEVLASEPTNVIALNNLSVIEIMKEHYEDAIKLISKVLAINPEDEIALANMNFIKEKLTSVLEQV